MIAEVTAGWLTTKAMASSMSDRPESSASAPSVSVAWSLALVFGQRHVEAGDESLPRGRGGCRLRAPATGQPAACQWAVDEDAHPVPHGGWEHVELDAANEQRVWRLLGAEALEVAGVRGPLGLDDLAGGVGGGADVADLDLLDEVGQRAEGFLNVGVGVGSVDQVEVGLLVGWTEDRSRAMRVSRSRSSGSRSVDDRAARGEGPGTAEEIAARTAWPGARTSAWPAAVAPSASCADSGSLTGSRAAPREPAGRSVDERRASCPGRRGSPPSDRCAHSGPRPGPRAG
jgi:hypothetical protein